MQHLLAERSASRQSLVTAATSATRFNLMQLESCSERSRVCAHGWPRVAPPLVNRFMAQHEKRKRDGGERGKEKEKRAGSKSGCGSGCGTAMGEA